MYVFVYVQVRVRLNQVFPRTRYVCHQSGSQAVRQYVPTIGRRVTLRQFSDYLHYLPSLTVWSHLTVRAIDGENVTVEHYNARDTGEFFTVPLSAIAPLIGWQAQYTIHCKPDQVGKVLG